MPGCAAEINKRMPYVDFAQIISYSKPRIRAARYLTSIQRQNLDDIDQSVLRELCRDTGVRVEEVNGRLSVSVKWSYFVGQSEGKAKVDSDWF